MIPRTIIPITALFAGLLLTTSGTAQEWGYEGSLAPQNWGRLDPTFSLCATGKNQSPVDLDGTIGANLKPLRLKYEAGAREIVNTGHTIQVNYAPGSALIVENQYFQLNQFQFRAPGENRIAGRAFPLEAQLFHTDQAGNLAVLSVMFSAGSPNTFLSRLWEKMPLKKGDRSELPAGLNVTRMLPALTSYYRFNGSLTTPPCSEGVRWIVFKSAVSASWEQIAQFAKTMGHPNNRPVQPVNARPLLK